jgi:hypothetical protein
MPFNLRAQIGAMSPARPSWRPLLAGTLGLFLVILAFLAGQLRSGGDPAIGRSAASQQATDGSTRAPRNGGSAPGFGTDPSSPDGGQSDGFIPGGTAPAPAVPDGSSNQAPSSDAPSTHQS